MSNSQIKPKDNTTKNLLNPDVANNELELCLLYTSDAADERSSVDLGGRRIIKKKKSIESGERRTVETTRQTVQLTYTQQL